MAKQRVVVLGCTGMLGSMVLDWLSKTQEFNLIGTCRNIKDAKLLRKKYPEVDFHQLDAEEASLTTIANIIDGSRWIINAIGVIKPHIRDNNAQEINRAIHVNARFPHLLAQAAEQGGVKVLQIASDCVYSGRKGSYVESDTHNPSDVYGKTKSLGEVFIDKVYHLRCSIVGPEVKNHRSLLGWFLNQPLGATVDGFTNHRWNGVTTLHFAKLCHGIIKKNTSLDHVQHVVPSNVLSKADLLGSFAREFKRKDVIIKKVKAQTTIDRSLGTNRRALNLEIWQSAGYRQPPTIEQMVAELARYNYSPKGAMG